MRKITGDQMIDTTTIAALDSSAPTSIYSGRGMYGEQCVGWDCESATDILRLGAALAIVIGGDASEMIEDARMDSMGRGTIVYFPGWQCDENIGDSNDEEEDDDDN